MNVPPTLTSQLDPPDPLKGTSGISKAGMEEGGGGRQSIASMDFLFMMCIDFVYGNRFFKAILGFPSSSGGKECACNAGDPGSIPGLGRSPGEGIGYPLQYSWVSLVAQLVKNLPAMRKTWVQSLSWKDPLEKATHSSILAWRIPWTV